MTVLSMFGNKVPPAQQQDGSNALSTALLEVTRLTGPVKAMQQQKASQPTAEHYNDAAKCLERCADQLQVAQSPDAVKTIESTQDEGHDLASSPRLG